MKEEKKRIVNLDDKKVIFSLAFVFIIGTLFSGTFTGNVGKIGVVSQLGPDEYKLYEGGAKIVNENAIRLEKISADGTIVIRVVTMNSDVQRAITSGHENYVSGYFITNIATNDKEKSAVMRIATTGK